MSRAMKESLDYIRASLSTSAIKTLLSGEGTPETRAAPTRSGNNDVKAGGRLDHGENYTKSNQTVHRLKFQLNKNAENSTLKKLAGKDSHKVWSHADFPVPVPEDRLSEVVDSTFATLKTNLSPASFDTQSKKGGSSVKSSKSGTEAGADKEKHGGN